MTETFNISPDVLRRVVGAILAKTAAKARRYTRRTGYRHEQASLDMRHIRNALMDKYAPHGTPINEWGVVHRFFKNEKGKSPVIRKALKYWEEQGKVKARRGGRYGNSYRWTLLAETKQWDRDKAKRKDREAKRKVQEAQWAKQREETQELANELAKVFNVDNLKVSTNSITITREQAETILSRSWASISALPA